VVGRIQMRAVVGTQLNHLYSPAFTVWQVFFFEAGKEGLNLFKSVVVREVLNFGCKCGRVTQNVVLKKNRKVNEFAGHVFIFHG
jgi:hypothetical protein